MFKDGSSFGVAPSLLSADFANFERDINRISNADFAHIDVMDNHFVPNLTFGQPVVKRIVEICQDVNKISPSFKSDVHLMIDDPDRWAIEFANIGASSVTFHYNAAAAPIRLARALREKGTKSAIALRPAEDEAGLYDILDEFDMILVMTVEPGFGGQKFLGNQMGKVKRLRERVNNLPEDKRPIIEVDGGVSRETVETVAKAGANLAVAGSAVYGADDVQTEIAIIRELGDKAYRQVWG
ncbi:MAG: ribulose-phosphate 3-epimerase [Candidatus Ancillula sp.]|jgi:ribulose-phosphate 3-epimerase|nr:ribulose-phosphate 3-epimerase [Candidatus Ancillula sp.]